MQAILYKQQNPILLTLPVLSGLFDDFYEYDPISHTWSNLSDLKQFGPVKPTMRKSHGFVSANGKLYVFGGLVGQTGIAD